MKKGLLILSAFSRKKANKRGIHHAKERVRIYLKQGENMKAADLKKRIEMWEKDAVS